MGPGDARIMSISWICPQGWEQARRASEASAGCALKGGTMQGEHHKHQLDLPSRAGPHEPSSCSPSKPLTPPSFLASKPSKPSFLPLEAFDAFDAFVFTFAAFEAFSSFLHFEPSPSKISTASKSPSTKGHGPERLCKDSRG